MLAISSSWLNQGVTAILSGIQEFELNTNGSGGSAKYRFVTGGKITIAAGEAQMIIPPTRELVNREVTVILQSGSKAHLFWDGIEEELQSFLELNPAQPTFKDTADGGMQLNALASNSDIELAIIIRQQEPILYFIGDSEMANIGCSLFIDTDKSYSETINNGATIDVVNGLTGSDYSVSGFKMFLLTNLNPETNYRFIIDASQTRYAGNKVDMQSAKIDVLASIFFKMGISEFLSMDLSKYLTIGGEWQKVFEYVGNTVPNTQGEIIIKPKSSFLLGKFAANNTSISGGDTCIITGYQPNTLDPSQGGTFTLGGF